MKNLFLALLVCVVTFFCIQQYILNQEKSEQDYNAIRFSTTQSIDTEVQKFADQPHHLMPNFYTSYTMVAPPQNSSQETQDELEYLHQLANNRTNTDFSNIHESLELTTTRFNERVLVELVNETLRPASHYLLFTAFTELSQIVVDYKIQFDRVRPSYLDPTLTTAIPVPNHPSYPSGHATQALFIALILSDLDPDNATMYQESAFKIAHYREIAGVHYPSDSQAGQDLAKAYFEALRKTTWYQEASNQAKKEW